MTGLDRTEPLILTYFWIKSLHTIAAFATLSGFIVRGYWMVSRSDNLNRTVTRIIPHIIDTILLVAAIALVMTLQLNVFAQPWLLAKITGLVIYIVLGTIAIKRGPSRQIRVIAFVSALSVFAYILGVAMTKSPASWLTFLLG